MDKKRKEAWENFPQIWKDEKAFMVYLRGAFRAVWSKYPAKLEWKKQQMVKPPVGYTGRAKTVGYCALCGEMGSASSFEVDHISEAGSFSNKEEAVQWFWRLLDTNDNWQIVCKPCHKCKSYADRMGIPFEDAKIAKQTIEIMKDSKKVLAMLQQHGYNHCRNEKQRREAISKILKENK